MKKQLLLLFTSLFLLSGCAATMVPVMTRSVDEAGNIITTITPHVTEASVAKSQAFYDMWSIRTLATERMFKSSGTTFKLDKTGRITSITVRGDVPIMQALPQKVDEYPAWATAERVGVALIKAVLWGYGINQVTDMLGGMAASAGTTYYGDFKATNSLNSAGTSQTLDYSPITTSTAP